VGAQGARPVVLDAGALIALERGDPRMRALARLSADSDGRLIVPAPVLAQVWRDGRRQVRLAALLGAASTEVDVLDEAGAKAAGVLCGRSGTRDVVDASVVVAARVNGAPVVTSDPDDLRRIDPALHVRTL
jgi:predicted nucleic acid-binding protein